MPSVQRPIIFGEVLFDHFPDGAKVLGGAPINVAWNLQAFGCQPLLITRVGDDPEGAEIKETLSAWGMDMRGVQTDPNFGTGAVHITLSEQGDASFDILDDRAYDFIEPHVDSSLPTHGVLYHGSLALRHDASRQSLEAIMETTQASSFVDINLRSPWWSQQDVLQWVSQARWLKINDDELKLLSEVSGTIEDKAATFCHEHDLDLLVLTQGAEGAFAVSANGQKVEARLESPVHVADTVGAGDAFASVVILGMLQDWPLDVTLNRAQDFASAVVGMRGATTTDLDFYAAFTAAWALDPAGGLSD